MDLWLAGMSHYREVGNTYIHVATSLYRKRGMAAVEDSHCLGNIVCSGWNKDAARVEVGSHIPHIDALGFVGCRVGM